MIVATSSRVASAVVEAQPLWLADRVYWCTNDPGRRVLDHLKAVQQTVMLDKQQRIRHVWPLKLYLLNTRGRNNHSEI